MPAAASISFGALPITPGGAEQLDRAGIRLGGILSLARGQRVARPTHPFTWLGVILTGSLRWHCRADGVARSGVARRGWVLVFPRRTPYWQEAGPHGVRALWFSLVESQRPDLGFRAGRGPLRVQRALLEQVRAMQREARSGSRSGQAAATLHAGLIAIQVDRLVGQGQTPGPGRIAKLAARIADNPAARWDAAAIARQLGRSVRQTIRMVQRHYLCTPHQLVLRLRLQAAQAMLRDRALAVRAVARAAGFHDAPALGHAFRRHLATSPAHWRAEQGRGAAGARGRDR